MSSETNPVKEYRGVLMTVSMRYIIVMVVCLGLTSSTVASDWICYKGSPERRSSANTAAPDTSYLMWEVDLGSELYSSPVVKDGKVFQVAFEEIVCIDYNTGKVLWTSSVPAYNSTPVLTDDKIIVATNRGVTALSIENGDFVWEYLVSGRFSNLELIDYIVSSPVVSEGKVVVGTRPYNYRVPTSIFHKINELYLVCLDETTGKEKWYKETQLGILSSPCIANKKVFAASREMLCIDLERGRILWNSEDRNPWNVKDPVRERYAFNQSTPALYHGFLVVGSCDIKRARAESHYTGWQKIVAMDQYTGEIFWEWIEEGILFSSPAISEGKVYLYSFDGMVRCLSLLDGEELWETSISDPKELDIGGFRLWPSPAVADGKVYIGSIEGIFYCLDALTGDVLWKYETGGPIYSVPAIVPGKVLISSTDGTLYCFGIDPATYKTKAEQYLEDKEYQKAEEYLLKAKENAETNEEIEEIDRLLNIVKSEMQEYWKKSDNLSEAESLIDEADKIIWDRKFEKAKELYTKACGIYEELDDEFGTSFCEKRIDYIEKRIAEQSWMEVYWWVVVVLGLFGAALILLFKKYR